MTKNLRTECLEEAESLVNGDRNNQYGDPNQDFTRTASYWNTHALGILERKIPDLHEKHPEIAALFEEGFYEAQDVAINMILLKMSRLAWSPEKADSIVDAAGYAACYYDITQRSVDRRPAIQQFAEARKNSAPEVDIPETRD